MLTRFRIEVEEQTIAETVEALAKYEHALVAAEAQRYEAQWPVELSTIHDSSGAQVGVHEESAQSTFSKWDMPFEEREFFIEELGVEITDEVVELVEPGLYRGRRVVKLTRIDTRRDNVTFIKPQIGYFEFNVSGSGVEEKSPNSGTNP